MSNNDNKYIGWNWQNIVEGQFSDADKTITKIDEFWQEEIVWADEVEQSRNTWTQQHSTIQPQ